MTPSRNGSARKPRRLCGEEATAGIKQGRASSWSMKRALWAPKTCCGCLTRSNGWRPGSATASSTAASRPLKLLETRTGVPVAEITQIMRQAGNYRKATQGVSEGRIDGGIADLDKLG